MRESSDTAVRPEVLAAITASLAAYGCAAGKEYRISRVLKKSSAWKKAGRLENMLAREMDLHLKY